MKLHQHAHKLWILRLVEKLGSMSAAALEARVSVSAVSQALTQLEAILGFPVITRSRGGVSLTPEGSSVLLALAPALDALDGFDADRTLPAPAPRRLRIGAYESIAIELLPRFVPLLRQRWPRMEVSLEIARSRVILEMCRRGDLDLAFVADATHAPTLHVRPYASDSYGVFVTRELGDRGPASTSDLAGLAGRLGFGALRVDDKHHTRSFHRYLKSLPAAPRPMLETESFEAILALVRGGALVGALPLRVAARARRELKRLDTPPRTIKSDAGRHDLSLACHSSFPKSMFDSLLGLARAESTTAL